MCGNLPPSSKPSFQATQEGRICRKVTLVCSSFINRVLRVSSVQHSHGFGKNYLTDRYRGNFRIVLIIMMREKYLKNPKTRLYYSIGK